MHVRKRDPLYPSKVLIEIHRYCCHICRVFYSQANRGARLPELMMLERGKVVGGNNNNGNSGENGKINLKIRKKKKTENGNREAKKKKKEKKEIASDLHIWSLLKTKTRTCCC